MRWAVATLAAVALAVLVGAQAPVDRVLVGQPEPLPDGATYPLDLKALGITIPKVIGDTQLDRRLNDPRTIFYRLGQVYQQWIPGAKVESRNLATGAVTYSQTPPVWHVYRVEVNHEFNANPDFPWEVTFGLNIPHREGKVGPGKAYDVFNFLSLPEDESGRLVPVTVLDERPVKWIFPPNTKVGEVIYARHDGKSYVQEIRTRTKSEHADTWHANVYRPVGTREEYQALTQTAYTPTKRYLHFRNPEETLVEEVSGTVERLPALPPEKVVALLARPFQDVTDKEWSPAPDQEFSLLPKDYSFGLLTPVNGDTCARCHRQTQISALNLTPLEPKLLANPGKVGNIRGCDAVFSWHPFSQRSIADKEGTLPGRFIYVRQFDVANGIVRVIGRGQAPTGDVKITKYVQESLKDYELPDKRYLHQNKHGCKCGITCACGDKCDCGPPDPPAWVPLIDNRTIVPDQGEAAAPAKAKPQPLRVPASIPIPQANAGAPLLWLTGYDPEKGRGRSYLFRNDGTREVVGVYEPRDMTFRPVGPDGATGAPGAPPIPITEQVRRGQ